MIKCKNHTELNPVHFVFCINCVLRHYLLDSLDGGIQMPSIYQAQINCILKIYLGAKDFFFLALLQYSPSRIVSDSCSLMRIGPMATRVKMSRWLLKPWPHKERNLHFAWETIFLWQYYPRSRICFLIISSNALLRFVTVL